MGSKEPIPKMILFINGYSITGLIYHKIIVPIQAETNILQLCKNFEFFGEKGDPWGDLSAPEATSNRRFLYFISYLIK